MQWALYFLTSHPEAMERLENEVKSVIGRDVIPTEEHLKKMPFVKAVIKETLRYANYKHQVYLHFKKN